MIDHLDNLLRQLLFKECGIPDSRISFQPPDEDWRTTVSTTALGNLLNVYLVDLRENRKLRSNERLREINNGMVSEIPAPARLDCHYLITAWSPASVSPAIEPTVDEHALLYRVAGALTNNEPLVPRQVYDPDPLPATFPQSIADAELPTTLLPVEGFAKYGEFWGTMGAGHRWRPAVYLIVTLPIVLEKEISGPMVTTRLADYRLSGRPETAEVMIEIGGHVMLPPLLLVVGSANVTGTAGATITVNDSTPFRIGDVVTRDNLARATVMQITGNDLVLNRALTGGGATLRIANLQPTQPRIRIESVATLATSGLVIITGEDAAAPGTVITDRAVVSGFDANDFVTLSNDAARNSPPRTLTYRMNVAQADAPTLTPLVAGAWVRLEDAVGTPLQTKITDADGRFRFGGLSAGQYTLRVRVQGFAEITRPIEVPSATGEYDVRLV